MKRLLIAVAVVVFGCGAGFTSVQSVRAARLSGSVAGPQSSSASGQEPSQDQNKMGRQKRMDEMASMHKQMMAEMKAADAKLDAAIRDMDAAQGPAKVEAMAQVIKLLASQREAMEQHMMQMHQQLMRQMNMMDHPHGIGRTR